MDMLPWIRSGIKTSPRSNSVLGQRFLSLKKGVERVAIGVWPSCRRLNPPVFLERGIVTDYKRNRGVSP